MTEAVDGAWRRTVLGGLRKSDVLDPGPESPLAGHRRIVDIVCRTCGERLGAAMDDAEGVRVVTWSPPRMMPAPSGEPLWSIEYGVLPKPPDEVRVHCFEHGHARVGRPSFDQALERYRRKGRRQRLPVETSTA